MKNLNPWLKALVDIYPNLITDVIYSRIWS